MTNTVRYSDSDLEIFKQHVTQKLEKAKDDLDFLLNQIQDIADRSDDEGDWMDETSKGNDLEMLHLMANRNRHHIRDLENALIRIENKSYGICMVTGELIDKRRLMAVPTTTKCLEAKNAIALAKEKPAQKLGSGLKKEKGKVITKIVQRNSGHPTTPKLDLDDDLFINQDDYDDVEDEESFDRLRLNLDNYSEE